MENNKTINDLPHPLIQEILLRLPVKSLLILRCVSKTWLHLISDPTFAKSHFELAAAPTRRCLFESNDDETLSFDFDALFHDGYAPVRFSPPCEYPPTIEVLESCRGFILLDRNWYRHLIIWNPITGSHKQISYSHAVAGVMPDVEYRPLCGFGYDPSKDDYIVVMGWRDINKEDHFEFFSVRNNSWKNFEVAIPNPLLPNVVRCGLFLNGAFHWVASLSRHSEAILVFDLMERSFSEIPLPQPLVGNGTCRLVELGGCLALYFRSFDEGGLKIWVMKEYKVQSSWTLYGNFDMDNFDMYCEPVTLSSDGNIIVFHNDYYTRGFSKCNFSGEQLEHYSYRHHLSDSYTMYTESLMSLPNDS